MEISGYIALLVALFLLTRRWFWVLVFGISALAGWFAVLASIFHWQILAALGFFFLASVCSVIAMGIAATYQK